MVGRLARIGSGLGGAAVGAALVLASIAWTPQTILARGQVVSVPGLTPASGLPAGFSCGTRTCGEAGVSVVRCLLTWPATISGTVHATAPYELALATTSDVACEFVDPPHPCTHVFMLGPAYEFVTDVEPGDLDLSHLELNFSGPTNFMPPGAWTLYFVNWSPSPMVIDVASAIITSPA